VTPALAARRAANPIHLQAVPDWVSRVESLDGTEPHVIVETAGGVFSPLSDQTTNLDLALTLDPAIWVLVAPDRLGVLHDIESCLQAMRALARWPDWIVLSAPAAPDESTGTNAAELRRRPAPPIITLPRDDPSALEHLLAPRGE
jgi:dethiobiotin synthetase